MNTKLVIGIFSCILIVGATLLITLQICEIRGYMNANSQNATALPVVNETTIVMGTIGFPVVPAIVIDVPVTCGPKEKFSAAMNKCVKSY